MQVSEAIQNARRSAGLTQEQLAAKVYVTRQAVSRWETGESEPGIDMRKLLARVLDVPVCVQSSRNRHFALSSFDMSLRSMPAPAS